MAWKIIAIEPFATTGFYRGRLFNQGYSFVVAGKYSHENSFPKVFVSVSSVHPDIGHGAGDRD